MPPPRAPDPDALESKLAELRPGFDLLEIPACVIDQAFRYRYANAEYAEFYGKAPGEMVGRTLPEIFSELPDDDRSKALARALGGESVIFDRITLNGPNRGHWVRAQYTPVRGTREVLGAAVFLMPIQHLKDAEAATAARERQLSLITDTIGFPVTYIDCGGIVRFANAHSAAWSGLTPETMIGRPIAEIAPPEIGRQSLPLLERAWKGEAVTYERAALWPGREARRVRGHMIPDRDPSGTVRGALVLVMDIEDDHRLRESLQAREDELRFFAENIPEAIVYVDLERGCTFVNNRFLETRGFTRESILGKFPKDVYSPGELQLLQPRLDRVAAGEEVVYERLVRHAPSGQMRWMRVRLTPRKDSAGRVKGFYVVSTDIQDLMAVSATLEDKERELRQVIDSIPTPMAYVDADQRYRYVNDALLSYVGRSNHEVIGRTVLEVLGPERHGRLQPVLERVFAGEVVTQERLIDFADGHSRWMIIRYTPRRDAAGEVIGYYATTSDIHEQKAVEDELRRANSTLSAHFENTPLAVIEWDPSIRAIRWSGSAESIFGWGAGEVLGRNLGNWRFVFEEDAPAVEKMIAQLLAGPGSQSTILNRNYRKDGSVIWVEWHNSALRDEAGNLVSILSLAQDVSSRIQAEERLQYMATHDGLTGLPNRLVLGDRLSAALARAQRAGNRVAVLFLDLDHFKDVNDVLGHKVGDELLRGVSRRIRALLRQSDLLVRISGDEFVVVLEDLEVDGGPDRVAQKILDEVLRPFAIEGHDVQVSASLGYAVFPDDGAEAETLIKNADAAMYHAKDLGRNSFRAFSRALAKRRDQRLGLEAALRLGVRNGEFELYYQPILDVVTGHVGQVEALIRWNDPRRGVVLPPIFIPVAEDCGLMRDIGRWVFEAAARQATAWNAEGAGPIRVGVNLSASQLRDSTIDEELAAILAATGCAADWLSLEIAETSMVKDLEGIGRTLLTLRRMGFRVAIDDFGTGFSSLSHLRHLPVDTLKIDRSFVADINGGDGSGARSGGAAIVAAVTGLARGLGLEVVAEGVERPSQLAFLREQGCTSYQGYLACRPLPAGEFGRWLAAKRKAAGEGPAAKEAPGAGPGPTRR